MQVENKESKILKLSERLTYDSWLTRSLDLASCNFQTFMACAMLCNVGECKKN